VLAHPATVRGGERVVVERAAEIARSRDPRRGKIAVRAINYAPCFPGRRSWVSAFAVESTGSYGAGLVRFLERAGVAVYECERPLRQERRSGKNDLIDAVLPRAGWSAARA
jgi:transposase